MNNYDYPLEFWQSDAADDLLLQIIEAWPSNAVVSPNFIERLRREHSKYTQMQLQHAIEVGDGISRAKKNGKYIDNWFFTRRSAEQSSSCAIANIHAEPFSRCKTILEICTGSGLDALAFLRLGAHVVSIESDPFTAEIARRNLYKNGYANAATIHCGMAEAVLPALNISSFDGIWSDPSRRGENNRKIISAEEYLPDLRWLISLPNKQQISGIKCSPAFDFSSIPHHWNYQCIGMEKECREIVLRYNANICSGETIIADVDLRWRPSPSSSNEAEIIVPKAGCFLLEPHPCLIRSGFLGNYFSGIGAGVLDRNIAYGVSKIEIPASPWHRQFLILDYIPYNKINIQNYIHKWKFSGDTEIKKRGFSKEPEELRKMFRFVPGGRKGVLIFTRAGNNHYVVFAERKP